MTLGNYPYIRIVIEDFTKHFGIAADETIRYVRFVLNYLDG